MAVMAEQPSRQPGAPPVAGRPAFQAYSSDELYRRAAASASLAKARQEALGDDLDPLGYATDAELRHLAAASGLTSATRGLDLGCGAGGTTLWLSGKLGCRMIGMDPAPVAIQQARARAGAAGARVRFLQGELGGALPFGRGGFDAVVSTDTLYWPGNTRELLEECHRVLRRRGRLAVLATHGAAHRPDPRLGPLDSSPIGIDYPELLLRAGFTALGSHDLTQEFVASATAVADRLADHLPQIRLELGQEFADALGRRCSLTAELARAGVLRRTLLHASAR